MLELHCRSLISGIVMKDEGSMKQLNESQLDELAIFNVALFIIWNIGHWCNLMTVRIISMYGAMFSLLIGIYFLYRIRQLGNKDDKVRLYKRLLNIIVFCIFFIVMNLV